MRGKLFAFVAALLSTVTAGSWAQQSGGFPSRPKFQEVEVRNAAGASDPLMRTYRGSSGVGVGVGILQFEGNNASSARVTYAGVQGQIVANTAGAHAGQLNFRVQSAGASTIPFAVTPFVLSTIVPLRIEGGTTRAIEFLPFGAGAAIQNGLQWFSDNNAYLDAPSTGTPTGGAINFRTGSSTTTRLTIDSAGNTNVVGALQVNGGTLVSADAVQTGSRALLVQGSFSSTLAAATTNDLNPWSGLFGNFLRLDSSVGAAQLNGITRQIVGVAHQLIIANVDTTDTITLGHDNAGSTAANRFLLSGNANLALAPNAIAWCLYDPSSSRWRCR